MVSLCRPLVPTCKARAGSPRFQKREARTHTWALLLKGQKGGGQSGQSWGSSSPVLLPHVIGQIRYGRGRKGKHKCWKQSLATDSASPTGCHRFPCLLGVSLGSRFFDFGKPLHLGGPSGTFARCSSQDTAAVLDSLRGSCVQYFLAGRGLYVNIGTIQRKLAWPLRKDDTHTSRSVNKAPRQSRMVRHVSSADSYFNVEMHNQES